jgi:hypothetical protein
MLITLLNDGTMVLIGYDRVRLLPSREVERRGSFSRCLVLGCFVPLCAAAALPLAVDELHRERGGENTSLFRKSASVRGVDSQVVLMNILMCAPPLSLQSFAPSFVTDGVNARWMLEVPD